MADQSQPSFLGLDLSTQQLKAIFIQSDLQVVHQAQVDFDADLSKYGVEKGVLTDPGEGEIFAPVAMWLEALDLVLSRLSGDGLNFSRVKAISGAGMQHGTVFWNRNAEGLLDSLDPTKSLLEQLHPESQAEGQGAFSHPFSPNWQDSSTQKQCESFDAYLGSAETLAAVTGSKAHHRFSGPQILRFRERNPESYGSTARISLVSSFLATLFLGKIAPIDIADVCGMNIWDIRQNKWHDGLLKLVAGQDGVSDIKSKLGDVAFDGGQSLGLISPYYVSRYGFSSSCTIIPSTGDNPATILSLPLRASDAIVSLGTSTTFLMSTPEYRPDPAYHFMNHPTTRGLYMFMLCYKNGGLAREEVRDALNTAKANKEAKTWEEFNIVATSTPPLNQNGSSDTMKLGLFFPKPEIVPNVPAGHWRFLYEPSSGNLSSTDIDKDGNGPWPYPVTDVRAIIESQFLSLRLRSAGLVQSHQGPSGVKLPPQPRRIYLVGGGSLNPAIAEICGQVLGGVEGVYRLDIGGNACALGAAYKAVWGAQRAAGQSFEDFIADRWEEGAFVKRIAEGYKEGVFERYGEALVGFEMMEKRVLETIER